MADPTVPQHPESHNVPPLTAKQAKWLKAQLGTLNVLAVGDLVSPASIIPTRTRDLHPGDVGEVTALGPDTVTVRWEGFQAVSVTDDPLAVLLTALGGKADTWEHVPGDLSKLSAAEATKARRTMRARVLVQNRTPEQVRTQYSIAKDLLGHWRGTLRAASPKALQGHVARVRSHVEYFREEVAICSEALKMQRSGQS